MIRINPNYQKLQASYLFSNIAQRVAAYQKANPDKPLIKMGIGDVTEPLPEVCRTALKQAVDEMGTRDGFHGYGPEQGYAFLREAIAEHEFQARGCDISADEIFVSDGSKCDSGNIQEIFGTDIAVAVPDPVYPVYVDTNVMAGRTGRFIDGRYEGLTYLDSTADNGYTPDLPETPVDLIYLCFPNNPTGAIATKEQLKRWVDYARQNRALILFDAAYQAFIQDENLPRSIYEIEGAKECAIEFRSFSKNAGFTGTRCAFTVVPQDLVAYDPDNNPVPLRQLWNRRHSTKFNGVSYPVQRAAAAIYSPEGKQQVQALIDGYMANARKIRETMIELGYDCVGGDHAPYVWIQTGGKSWDFFDKLLNEAGVVCTPGAGFGKCGEGHIRLSAFNTAEKTEQALKRIREVLAR
ncbi:MAG: LL-diaminopimelate aminotransferase [Verrucomicrobiota bacterium JB022]|nr:LL-diaminopimelate aminotransferase [Verrucomicrobiota bacterium JB022]